MSEIDEVTRRRLEILEKNQREADIKAAREEGYNAAKRDDKKLLCAVSMSLGSLSAGVAAYIGNFTVKHFPAIEAGFRAFYRAFGGDR